MVACVIAAALALVVAGLFHLLYNYRRVRHIPGPVFTAFSDLWRVRAQRSSGYNRCLAQLHRKYGKAVRLGPDVISLSDARDIVSIYRARALDEFSRNNQEDRPSDQQELFGHEDAVAEAMRDTVRTIRRHRTIDLSMSLRLFADELRAWFLSGVHLAEPHSRSQAEPSSSFFTTIEEMLLRGPVYILKRDRFSCYGLSNDVSAPAYGHYPVSLRGVYKDAGRPYESSVIATSIETIIATLVFVFAFLLNQPRIFRRLRNEIDNMPRFWNRTTVPHSGDFTGAFYLDAVLKETMRLALMQNHPTGIGIKTGPRDIPLSFTQIRQGTTVMWHPYLILANESIYGNDPAIFRPERWLSVNRRQRACMEEPLLPFTACAPHCPKLEAAWLHAKKAVVVLLREFDDIQLLQNRHQDTNSEIPNYLEAPSMLVECRPRVARGRGYFGQLA